MPPLPAWRREANTSSSSIAESDITEMPETPSLSRASSESGASAEHEELRAPPHAVDELGVLGDQKGDGPDAPGVELRVNDVTVEIIELKNRERGRAQASTVEVTVAVPELKLGQDEKGRRAPTRRGTLKRVWKKLTGGAKG